MASTAACRPVLVTVAAFALGSLASWRLAVKIVLPLIDGRPIEVQEAISILFSFWVVWGILALQRWAWWLAVISSGLMLTVSSLALLFVEEIKRAAEFPQPGTFAAVLLAVAAASLVSFGCLLPGSSRRAFSSQSPTEG